MFTWDFPYASQRMPLLAKNVVATSQPLAAQAGLQALANGGNAVDAALAASFVSAVVKPETSGPGGDLFALVYMKKTGKVEALNAGGPAPAKASIEAFHERGLRSIPQYGPLAIAVPGAVDGWLELHKKYGTIDLARLTADIMGDGDALAIGGNHFIHAARRNIGITALVVNNSIYGMTGGQYSPTTPLDMRATTAPYGNVEPPFPVCDLAAAAGAIYVARSTVYHPLELDKYLSEAISTEGFSLVEAVSYCHTTYGRINKLGSAADMMRSLKDNSISKSAFDKLSPEEREHNTKIVRGVLDRKNRPEYTRIYDSLVERKHEEELKLRNVGRH